MILLLPNLQHSDNSIDRSNSLLICQDSLQYLLHLLDDPRKGWKAICDCNHPGLEEGPSLRSTEFHQLLTHLLAAGVGAASTLAMAAAAAAEDSRSSTFPGTTGPFS